MSNPTEAQLLTQDDYQEKVAWAIYMGIMQVINNE
jgi:N-acetylmuramoyl-L-alanine amidase